MKKIMILLSVVALSGTMFAQNQVSRGWFLIEANTGNSTGVVSTMISSTNFGFTKQDNYTRFSYGLDGGYCIMDNLALKAGLGYYSAKINFSDSSVLKNSAISYRLGAKYYVMSKIPVTLDVTGQSGQSEWDGVSTKEDELPMWLGIGAGYAFFLGDNVSIEPGLRYNMNLNSAIEDLPAVIQFNVGFALHF
jgi:hypothetical protein